MPISELERFAFNQARFVMFTAYTLEREECRGTHWTKALDAIRNTENGKRFLSGVSEMEIKHEMRTPGHFMNSNTQLGYWLNNEYGSYVEEFKEI